MGLKDIYECLPHRFPFLLVDRVSAYTKGESIVAHRNISISDPILQGHFPGNPIVPGVVVIEGLAQASAILGRLTKGVDCESCLLMEINEARFRRQVVPGDVVDYRIVTEKKRKDFFWFAGEAWVGGELAAKAKLSAKLS